VGGYGEAGQNSVGIDGNAPAQGGLFQPSSMVTVHSAVILSEGGVVQRLTPDIRPTDGWPTGGMNIDCL